MEVESDKGKIILITLVLKLIVHKNKLYKKVNLLILFLNHKEELKKIKIEVQVPKIIIHLIKILMVGINIVLVVLRKMVSLIMLKLILLALLIIKYLFQ